MPIQPASGQTVRDLMTYDYCPQTVADKSFFIDVASGEIKRATTPTSARMVDTIEIKAKDDKNTLWQALHKAGNTPEGNFRFQQSAVMILALAKNVFTTIRKEGTQLPAFFGKVSQSLGGAMTIGLVTKGLFWDLPQFQEALEQKYESGAKTAEVLKKKNVFLDPKGIKERVVCTVAKLPFVPITKDHYLARKEEDGIRRFESHDMKVFSTATDIAKTGLMIASIAAAMFAGLSVPILATVITGVKFISSVQDVVTGWKEMNNGLEIASLSIDEKVNQAYENDIDPLLKKQHMKEVRKELVLRKILNTDSRERIIAQEGSSLVDDVIYSELIQKVPEADQPTYPVGDEHALDALIAKYGDVNSNEINDQVNENEIRDIRHNYQARMDDYRQGVRIKHSFKMIKIVGFDALPFLFALGSNFYPPLAFAAAAAGVISAVPEIAKKYFDELVKYKATESTAVEENGVRELTNSIKVG